MSNLGWKSALKRALVTTAGVGMVAATLSTASLSAQATTSDPTSTSTSTSSDAVVGFKTGNYIVTLTDIPAGAYRGGVKGYPATRPARGEKFDATTAAAVKYRGYLTAKHNRLLQQRRCDGVLRLHRGPQRLRRPPDREAGGDAGQAARRACGAPRHDPQGRHVQHPRVPRVCATRAASGTRSAASRTPARTSSSASSTPASGPRASRSPGAFVKRNQAGQIIPGQGVRASWRGICQEGEQLERAGLQRQADRRPLLRRRLRQEGRRPLRLLLPA